MNSLRLGLLSISLLCFNHFKASAQEEAEIPRVNSPVVIDGMAESLWDGLQSHPITYLIDGKSYPDSADCSGYFKAFWNRDTLYVLIHAMDNKLYTKDPTVYYNDGFEIYLNVNFTEDTVYTSNCYQFRFIPGSEKITGRWGLNVWTPPTVDFAIEVDDSADRTLEAVFPLVHLLGKETPLAAGDSMGFEIEILDNDGSGRNHVLSWNNNEHMAWYNPAMMGTISFTGGEITTAKDLRHPGISVYPNPVSGTLFINSPERVEEITLYSLLGEVLDVQRGLSVTSFSYDMGHHKEGIYLLRLKLENERYQNFRICKRGNE
jgi:hypothetical protein